MTDATSGGSLGDIDATVARAHAAIDALYVVVDEARRNAPHLLGTFTKAFCDMDDALRSLLPGGGSAAQAGMVIA